MVKVGQTVIIQSNYSIDGQMRDAKVLEVKSLDEIKVEYINFYFDGDTYTEWLPIGAFYGH